MKFKKALVAGMVAVACVGALATPASFAGGYNSGVTSTAVYQALSSDEMATLQYMREEEKVARDVYLTLYNQWQLPVFSNIASSEQQHTDKIKALLQTYGVADPVMDNTVGVFVNQELASLYATLVTQGQVSVVEALKVGVLIEETDIADLQKAISETTHADIANVYTNLMKGSQNHLSAFSSLLDNLGAAGVQ